MGIRAKAMSLTTASNWLWNFAIGYATPYLVDQSTSGPNGIKAANLGAKVFFIWGSTCVGCWVFTYFCIPETKGLSLEQIDLLYQNTTPRKSKSYRAHLLENDIGARDVDGEHGADIKNLHRTSTGEKSVRSGGVGPAGVDSDSEKGHGVATHSETV